MAGEAGRLIVVTGAVRARPETFDALLTLANAHVAQSRTEPGCLAHAVHRDVEDPLRLFFFERWSDREALETHFRHPSSRAFVRAVGELAAEPPTLEIYEANRL